MLGVPPDSTLAQVRAAHRLRAQLLHPDKHASGSGNVVDAATLAMQQLNEALHVLVQLMSPPGSRGEEAGAGGAGPRTGSGAAGGQRVELIVCMQCCYAQDVPTGNDEYLCLRCAARMTRSVCTVCDTPLALWGRGPLVCPRCGTTQGAGEPAAAPAAGGVGVFAALIILVLLMLLLAVVH